jgi:hypothetical protein
MNLGTFMTRFFLGLIFLNSVCLDARCKAWQVKCLAKEAAAKTREAAEATARAAKDAADATAKAAEATKKAAEDTAQAAVALGKHVESAGGVVAQAGITIGNVTIKTIAKAGDITLDVAGKAGGVVLKVGETVVTAAGTTLLNAGGVIYAITSGDFSTIKDCAGALEIGARLAVSTVVNETLKAAGTIDNLIKISKVAIEASSVELALQDKTPKISISGSFFGRDFNLKDVQFDLSSRDKFATGLVKELLKLKAG